MDKLCRERISAERTECNHRMDRRALQERIVYSKELRKLEVFKQSLSLITLKLVSLFVLIKNKTEQNKAAQYETNLLKKESFF